MLNATAAEGTNAYVYTQLWLTLPAKDMGHTKKEKKIQTFCMPH